nr:hypothetical protein CFP56_03241 [Quercus suber]
MNPALPKALAFWQGSDLTNFESECDKSGGRAEIEAKHCDRELLVQKWTLAGQWKVDLTTALRKIDSIQQITRSLDVLHIKADLPKLSVIWEAVYNSSVEEKRSLCLSGTRSEILHKIYQWIDRPDGKFIFWLRGKAGTG